MSQAHRGLNANFFGLTDLPSEVINDHIVPFVPLSELVNLILVSRQMKKIVKRGDYFKFLLLWSGVHTRHHRPESSFPSAQFLASPECKRLMKECCFTNQHLRLDVDYLWGMSEELVREIIKLGCIYSCTDEDLMQFEWFHQDAKDLWRLAELLSTTMEYNKEIMDLIVAYRHYVKHIYSRIRAPSVSDYLRKHVRAILHSGDRVQISVCAQLIPDELMDYHDQLDSQMLLELLESDEAKFCIILEDSHVLEKDHCIAAIKSGVHLDSLPERFRKDEDLILLACSRNNVPAHCYHGGNRDLILKILDVVHTPFRIPKEYRDDREIFLKAVQRHGEYLLDASDELKNDRELVLTAIRSSPYALEYASVELRNDREIVMEAIKRDGMVLEYASGNLRENDEELIELAIKKDIRAIQFTTNMKYLGNKAMVMDYGIALTAEQKNDPDFVSSRGKLISYEESNDLLLCDEDIAIEKLRSYNMNLRKRLLKQPHLRNNLDFIWEVITNDGEDILLFPDYMDDKFFAFHACANLTSTPSEAFEAKYLQDPNFVNRVVSFSGNSNLFTESLTSRDVTLEALKKSENFVGDIPEESELWKDHKTQEAAIEYGYNFEAEYRNNELAMRALLKPQKNNLQIITSGRESFMEMIAHERCINIEYKNLQSEYLRDKEFVMEALDQTTKVMSLLSEELRSDPDIALKAVTRNGLMLKWLCAEMRDNEIYVLTAVEQVGLALGYASLRLRSKFEIALKSVKQNGGALRYVPESLLCGSEGKTLILEAVKNNGLAIAWLKSKYIDRDIVLAAEKQNGCALEYIPKKFIPTKYWDRELLVEAVKQQGTILRYIPRDYRDKELMLLAVQNNVESLRYIPFSARIEYAKEFIECNGNSLAYMPFSLSKRRDLTLIAVKQNGMALEFATLEFKRDKEIVVAATRQNVRALQFASIELIRDLEFIREVVMSSDDNNRRIICEGLDNCFNYSNLVGNILQD